MLWPRTGRKRGQNATSFSRWVCKALLFIATVLPADTDGHVRRNRHIGFPLEARALVIGGPVDHPLQLPSMM